MLKKYVRRRAQKTFAQKYGGQPGRVSVPVKTGPARMETKKGLYAQVFKLRRKDLKFIVSNNNKNEAKFKFQGQSARSHRWFGLDFDWIKVNFSTREPDLYKRFFNIHDNTQDKNTFKYFKFQ